MNHEGEQLPRCITEYLSAVINKMRYRRQVRREVQQELTNHFADALADCESEQEKQRRAEKMIARFGDAKLLARLIRRGKKRCRPLWKKALIRTGQAALAGYVISILFNAWALYTWRADINIYVERFNQLNRPTFAETENAWPYYEKAAGLFVKPPEYLEDIFSGTRFKGKISIDLYAELNEEEKAGIENYLADNEAAWQGVLQAVHMEYCWREIPDASPETISKIENQLGSIRSLARLGLCRTRHKVAQNQLKEAVDECLAVLELGCQMSQSKLMNVYLVGRAITAATEETLLKIIAGDREAVLSLTQIQSKLDNLFPQGYPMYDGRGELTFSLASMTDTFEKTGLTKLRGLFFPGTFVLLGNRRNIEENALDWWENTNNLSLYQQEKLSGQENFTPRIPQLLLDLLKPALKRTIEINYRSKAIYESLVTIIALQRWKLDKEAYPENMQELIAAGFLLRLPDDPYSESFLKYQRQGEDFILYSVGADFDDDGGTENPEDLWGEEDAGGDRVFWPIK